MFSFIQHAKVRTDRGWRVFQSVKCASATFVYCAHKVQTYMHGQRLLVKNKMAMLSFAKRNISRQKSVRKPEKHSSLHGRSIIFWVPHGLCLKRYVVYYNVLGLWSLFNPSSPSLNLICSFFCWLTCLIWSISYLLMWVGVVIASLATNATQNTLLK